MRRLTCIMAFLVVAILAVLHNAPLQSEAAATATIRAISSSTGRAAPVTTSASTAASTAAPKATITTTTTSTASSQSSAAQSSTGVDSTFTDGGAEAGNADGGSIPTFSNSTGSGSTTDPSANNGPVIPGCTGGNKVPGNATAPLSADNLFCHKYTAMNFDCDAGGVSPENQMSWITNVITRALMGNKKTTPAVAGIMSSTSPLLKFFDGKINYRHTPPPSDGSNRIDGGGATHAYGNQPQSPNFFAGNISELAVSINPNNTFTDMEFLTVHLIQFFGARFGCDMGIVDPVTQDTSLGYHTGNTNMTFVHENMNLGNTEFSYFNDQLYNSLRSFGTTEYDITNYVKAFMSTYGRYPPAQPGLFYPAGNNPETPSDSAVCAPTSDCPTSPSAYTFCERYSPTPLSGKNQVLFLNYIITRAFKGWSATPGVTGIITTSVPQTTDIGQDGLKKNPIGGWFNGSLPARVLAPKEIRYTDGTSDFIPQYGAVDFTKDLYRNKDYTNLAAHMIQFLGPMWGCRHPDFATASGMSDAKVGQFNPNLYAIHAHMNIGQSDFDYFEQQFIDSFLSFGVLANEMPYIRNTFPQFLRGNGAQSVCTAKDCQLAPGGSESGSAGLKSANSLMVLAVSVAILLASLF